MFNPVKASKNIKDEFISYISTSFQFANNDLRKQFCVELNKNIANGPWLEINDIFKVGKTINELIDEGVLSPLYRDLEAKKPDSRLYKRILPLDRPLYLHQERAIRAIASGNNAVISTGTGSGKTNCFLIPVLNELLKEIGKGTLGPGIRALFIYPMNALANDQMKNIRKILMYYPKITFGVYNGGTENDEEQAINVYEAMFATEPIPELRHRLPNELLSRDEMKSNPPNILFTNYAMLEHLLFRPKDDVLFSKSDFKFVVLDEAHVYSGATGIETALLLRRLRARIFSSTETQFILTSATLGNGENSDNDILTFAENLCGVEFNKNNIIRAERQKFIPSSYQKQYSNELIRALADERSVASKILSKYGINCDCSLPESELLYNLIIDSELYNTMRVNIEKVSTFQDVQKILNLDMETTTAFISLCTRAQKNNRPLVDARYHYFIRSLEGCYLTLNNKLFLTRQKEYYENNIRYAVFEVALCDECGKYAIVGKEINKHLEQVGKLGEDVDYFYLAKDINDEIEDETEDVSKLDYYYLCPHCGAIVPENQIKNIPCDCCKNDYVKIVKSKPLGIGARCGNCHRGVYKRLYLGNDAATSVLATALYEELPELVYEEDDNISAPSKNIFAKAVQLNKKKEKRTGRQFLAFSDSRQEAAKFACYLGKSYNEFLRRRGIYQIIKENADLILKTQFTISDFVKKLTALFSSKRSFVEKNNDISNLSTISNKNAWVAIMNELVRFNSSTSLTSLGVLQFSYMGITSDIVKSIAELYAVDEDCVRNLLNLLVFEIVKAGAICTDSDTDIDDNDREYIFYTPAQRFISKEEPANKKSTISSWMPKNKNGQKGEFYRTNKLYYVTHFLGIDNIKAAEFLEQFFDYLTDYENNNYHLIDKNKDGTYVLPAKYFQVKIANAPTVKWYKCSKCGKISIFNMNGKCTTIKCEDKVNVIDAHLLSNDNHFANLYFSDRMSPLLIKEHTAQLSKKESAEYQEEFIKKEINALSCSTTFEMGVDVGDLETVFLRDVPPLPSNYAQRAGRAGRSVDAVAYALTFAKLSSHDLSFFKEPDKMINGIILPPLFKLDNEKIVRRHIYAIALSMFFANHPDLYNHNDAEKFINERSYQLFIDWLLSKPERLKDIIHRSIPNENNLYERLGIESFKWLDAFIGEDGVFTVLMREYEHNIKEFEKLIKNFTKANNLDSAAKCERKLKNYKKNKLTDFLARGNILPRYGFPVDTVELEQNTTAGNINKLRLSRDMSIAIAEYAPSSEVVADGKLYTSRYIKKSNIGNNNKEWYTAYIGECDNPDCKCINYSITPIQEDGVKCSACGNILAPIDFHESIEPRSGFVTEREAKDVPLSRQEKNYKSDDYYIGNTESKIIEKFSFLFNNINVTMESTTNDSLLVKSSNNFYVCPKCGFAYAEDENITDDKEATKAMKQKRHRIKTTNKHESLFGQYSCDCQELIRYSLHHTFNTDVVKLNFNCDTSDYKTMVSTMYALLYAISKDMNIERKDIKACLSLKVVQNKQSFSIIIYDAVPGGAGHSRRLVTQDGMILYNIIKSALKNMEMCQCNPSCYNCLRSYENQKIHDMLDRQLAIKFLKQLIGNVKKCD